MEKHSHFQAAVTMPKPIYLDNNATTPVDPKVVECMLDALKEDFGNPSSKLSFYGNRANEMVEIARNHIAQLAHVTPQEIVFTSGATESINLVLRGLHSRTAINGFHVVTIATEHSATLDTLVDLEKQGAKVTRLPVHKSGLLELDALKDALKLHPQLFTISHANNEIGTIQPVAAIADLCKQYNVLFHVDAAQSFGKVPVQMDAWNVDFLSVSGHKLNGPKGIGCLIIKHRNPPLRLSAQITGGGQERGIRSGTLNVPGIVGFGKACEIAREEMQGETCHIENLRNEFKSLLTSVLPGVIWNGTFESRLPGNLNFSIPGIQAELLLIELRNQIAISSGSACHSRSSTPSHVLEAIGVSAELAFSSLRACIGRFNSHEEIVKAVDIIYQTVRKISI